MSLDATEEPLLQFVSALWQTGRVAVPNLGDGKIPERELSGALMLLSDLEFEGRGGLPGEVPAFSREAATWGLLRLYRASSLLLHREASAERLPEVLGGSYPGERTASVHYSVDLSFRFLPDLFEFAKELSPNDPLCGILKTWGEEWPVSGVGIVPEALSSVAWEEWWGNDCLRMMFLERVCDRRAMDWLGEERVARGREERQGGCPELAPEMMRELVRLKGCRSLAGEQESSCGEDKDISDQRHL
ncbi:MAG: hypothetical protein U0903_19305 [Planctomycetales bacterium]